MSLPPGGIARPSVLFAEKTEAEAMAAAKQAPPAPPEATTWASLAEGLPVHEDEILSTHTGQPGPQQQATSHGAGRPARDSGQSDQAKYA